MGPQNSLEFGGYQYLTDQGEAWKHTVSPNSIFFTPLLSLFISIDPLMGIDCTMLSLPLSNCDVFSKCSSAVDELVHPMGIERGKQFL
jgi:hypothetical protein